MKHKLKQMAGLLIVFCLLGVQSLLAQDTTRQK